VSIVWPCPLPADAYAAAGRQAEFPCPDCPSCAVPLVFWSGCRRFVRVAGRCLKIFVPRVRCGPCGVTHALLPAFGARARDLGVAFAALAVELGGAVSQLC